MVPFPDLNNVVRQIWEAFLTNIYGIIVFGILAALLFKTLTDERRDWRGFAFAVLGTILISAFIYNLPAIAEWLNTVARSGGGGVGGPRP